MPACRGCRAPRGITRPPACHHPAVCSFPAFSMPAESTGAVGRDTQTPSWEPGKWCVTQSRVGSQESRSLQPGRDHRGAGLDLNWVASKCQLGSSASARRPSTGSLPGHPPVPAAPANGVHEQTVPLLPAAGCLGLARARQGLQAAKGRRERRARAWDQLHSAAERTELSLPAAGSSPGRSLLCSRKWSLSR